MNLNTATIVGRLTRDPETKVTETGTTITTFSVATSRTYKDKEETEYHNIVTFGLTAENCGKYLTKGTLVGLFGRLTTRSWDKDGVKHYRTEIIADNVSFGPKPEPSKIPNTNVDYPDDNGSEIPF